MGIVGGFIGWMTNYFAIGMLFRPYEPITIGKFQLPFTPGVIPKRRKEIAKSVGKIVGRDLIHVDKLILQILSPNVKQQLTQSVTTGIHKAFQTELTPKEFCVKYLGIQAEQLDRLEDMAIYKVQSEVKQVLDRTVHSILEDTAGIKKEKLMEKAAKEIQDLLVKAMEAPGFRQVLIDKIDDFMMGLGFIAKMVTQVVQADTIADKIISGIQPYTRSETVYAFLYQGLKQTWEKYEDRPLGEVLSELGVLEEDKVNQGIASWLKQKNPLEIPISKLLKNFDQEKCIAIGEQMMDTLFTSEYVRDFLGKSLQKFDFEMLIEEEINRLSLPDLEAKVYEIARRELFMIQVLGGILGFLIGLVQALLFMYVFSV